MIRRPASSKDVPDEKLSSEPLFGDLIGKAIEEAKAAVDGTLTLLLSGHTTLTVPADPDFEAWTVAGAGLSVVGLDASQHVGDLTRRDIVGSAYFAAERSPVRDLLSGAPASYCARLLRCCVQIVVNSQGAMHAGDRYRAHDVE